MILFLILCLLSGLALYYGLNLVTRGRYGRAQKRFYRNLNEKYGMGSIKDHDDPEDTE